MTTKLDCDDTKTRFLFLDKSEYPELLSNAEKGDRVVKDKNSLLFKLFKKDSTIIEFYPLCDGEYVR